jgi:hypothetical protein
VGTFAGNDNLVYDPTAPNLDFAGLAFAAGGHDYNIYYGEYGLTHGFTFPPAYDGYGECRVTGKNCIASGLLATQKLTTWSMTAVPEPAEWMLLMVGFAGLGAARFAGGRRVVATSSSGGPL